MKQGWAVARSTKGGKPPGYRMLNSKTGAKGPGHGPDGPATLDEVEEFLKMPG